MKYTTTWHGLHLILSLFTGVWILIWVWRGLANADKNKQMSFKLQQESLLMLDKIFENKGDK